MNLRTFLPPAALPTAEPPASGEPARRLPPPGRRGGEPAVIAFLRHTGCPFAEATLLALREAADAHPQIEWIAISHAGPEATQRWCDAIGGRGDASNVVRWRHLPDHAGELPDLEQAARAAAAPATGYARSTA